MYANAGRLFQSAVDFYKGVTTLNPVSTQAQRECLASVIFAAMSAEAFPNELQQLSLDISDKAREPESVRALGQILSDAEDSRLQLKAKYQLIMLILSGAVLDKGAQPFQDFALLVDVRNLIVHWKPEEAVLRRNADGVLAWETKIMSQLEQRGAITKSDLIPSFVPTDQPVEIRSDLLSEMSVQSMGIWACSAVAGIVNTVLDAIPASPRFRPLVETMYRKAFTIADAGNK